MSWVAAVTPLTFGPGGRVSTIALPETSEDPMTFRTLTGGLAAACAIALTATHARAQRVGENAVAAASDAFGVSVGTERIGVYATDNVRGFSPITAGNRRIEGMYVDTLTQGLTPRLVTGSTIRVGLASLGYAFPAPSGIVDYGLRPSGDEFVASIVAGRPAYGDYYLEVDAQLPILRGRLSAAAGAGIARNNYSDGRSSRNITLGLIPRLRFPGGSLTAFWTFDEYDGDTGSLMVTAGPYLPPEFEPERFEGQSWAKRLQRTHNYGAIGHLDLAGDWRLSAAAFEARSTRYRTFIDLFLDVGQDGSATNVMISEPVLPARWTSGEARLTWAPASADFAHQLQLSLRGRDKLTEGGGGGSAVLGPARIGVANPVPEPDFVFQSTTFNSVTQWSAGLSYIGRWRRFAELNLGVQSTRYRQVVERDGVTGRTRDDRLIYSAAVAVRPVEWLTLYGGRTVGLEETAPPPQSASNRDDPPPASPTQQWDAGLRLSFGDTRIVAGVFETRRPYFATDQANFYRRLGERRNRGIEFSVIAQPLPGLRAVAGLVYYDPRVIGPAVASGQTGPRPLGSTPLNARLDLDYAVPWIEGLSLQLAAIHTGAVIASTRTYDTLGGRQLRVPAVTTLDVGARYRFGIGGIPMAARLSLQNLTDERLLQVSGSNSFFLRDVRRLSFQLSADF